MTCAPAVVHAVNVYYEHLSKYLLRSSGKVYNLNVQNLIVCHSQYHIAMLSFIFFQELTNCGSMG